MTNHRHKIVNFCRNLSSENSFPLNLGFKTDGVDDESSSSDGSHKKYSAKTFQRFSSYLAVIAAGAFIASR